MRKILAVPVAALTLVLGLATPAAAAPTRVIVLPGATSAEAITAGPGTTFYAGDLFGGDIFRGDIRRGTAEKFIDVPAGTMTVGMDLDQYHGLLYVAGGPGKAYIYDIRTRTLVKTYNLGTPDTSFINDVTLTPDGAWFTDSNQPVLYFVPIVHGIPGSARTLNLSGPAVEPGTFINDIIATPSGRTLLVAPGGHLVKIDPSTGTSELIAGVDIPLTDGLVLSGHHLWAVHFDNRVTRWHLNDDLTAGTQEKETIDPNFGAPVTAAKFGNRLAVVNSHIDTGYPPTNPTYEIVIIDA